MVLAVQELDNLPAGRHQLTYNGQPLASHQSLASYGIDTSAMLELVPLDPLTGTMLSRLLLPIFCLMYSLRAAARIAALVTCVVVTCCRPSLHQ